MGRAETALRRLSDVEQNDLAVRLDRLFAAVAAKAADDSTFARALSEALDSTIPEAPATDPNDGGKEGERRRSTRGGGSRRRPPGPFDPHALYSADGASTLRERLKDCSVEELKNIVAEHGMDHDRLAMKWKSTERLIERIASTVEAQARKGEAFR